MNHKLNRPLCIFIPHCSDVLTDTLPHGDGQVAYGFLKRLAENGHELHVATPRLEVKGPLNPNLHVYVLATRHEGLRGRVEFMIQLRRLFQSLHHKHRFDIMHQMNPVFTGISLALWDSRLPLVLGTYVARWPKDPDTISGKHGGLRGRLTSFLLNSLARIQQKQADLLLVTTPAAFNRLPQPDHVRGKIRMLGHGIDTTLFSPADDFRMLARYEGEQELPRVLFVGNIWLRKGIISLIDAWATVVAQLPGARLDIIGDGRDLPAMRAQVQALGLDRSVTFIGNVPRANIVHHYRACTLFVAPSLGEPYGTTCLEAMSCGRPVVITNAGGLPAMVPQAGGLRVPVDDAPALSGAILQLLRDPEARRAMAIANRSYVLSTYDWLCVVQALEACYAELIPAVASVMDPEYTIAAAS